jgi:hypothetical protein
VAAAIQQPGGEQAVQLKVAEKAVDAYGQLAKKNNTMIVPGNMTEVAGADRHRDGADQGRTGAARSAAAGGAQAAAAVTRPMTAAGPERKPARSTCWARAGGLLLRPADRLVPRRLLPHRRRTTPAATSSAPR